MNDEQALLAVAVEAATCAGELLAERARHGAERRIASKSTPTDLVSEADLASERAIRELLARRRPDDGFVGEEGDHVEGTSGLSWIVDPLDGTVNFLYGIPQWSVSIAVRDTEGTLAGAVFDPGRQELFTATRSGPAMLASPHREVELWGGGPESAGGAREGAGGAGSGASGAREGSGGAREGSGEAGEGTSGAREGSGGAGSGGAREETTGDEQGASVGLVLASPGGEELATAMVATGLAYDADVRDAQGRVLARLVSRVRDVRRFGSAALDLVWTAAGRYDAYFERTVKQWDIAAGVLVCERAGLQVLELPERERLPWGILVARPALARGLMELVGEE